MKAIKFILTLSIISGSVIFSQVDSKIDRQVNDKQDLTALRNIFPSGEKDYKIINSNSSYIEIEFIPSNITKGRAEVKGESFDVFDFTGSVSGDFKSAGEPNLRYRSFNIALPSDFNNTVQVLDYDFKELSGINLAPVPFINFKNPELRSFENAVYSYIKGSKYSENIFLPGNISILGSPGNVRELQNIIGRAYFLSSSKIIQKSDLPINIKANGRNISEEFLAPQYKEAKEIMIEKFEIEYLTHHLRINKGNITKTAESCGIDRRSIHRLINKYNIIYQEDNQV